MNFILSTHAKTVIHERGLSELLILQTIETPDLVLDEQDGTKHYVKRIAELNGKYLRVTLNPHEKPAEWSQHFSIDF